jgi:hypothetical protein
MKYRTVQLAVAGLITAACAVDPPQPPASAARDSAGVEITENAAAAWTPGSAWILADEPRVSIPSDGPIAEEFPLDPASAFMTPRGELVVADGLFNGWNKLLVYDSLGNYLRSQGRPGPGPCEFGQLWWASPYPGDSVAAFDYSKHLVAVFDPSGQCAREIRLPTHAPPLPPGTFGFADGADGIFSDGSVAISYQGWLDNSTGPGLVWYRQAIVRASPTGEPIDSLGVFGITQAGWNGSERVTAPYGLRSLRFVHDMYLYEADGAGFEYRVYDQHGSLLKIVRRSTAREAVQPSDRSDFVTFYLDQVRSSPESTPASVERMRLRLEEEAIWPELKPAITGLLVDSAGNVWVENYRWFYPLDVPANPPPTTWSVFDDDGRFLGEVTVPGRLLLRSIADDHVVGLWKLENGLSEVRVYSLHRDGTL